MIAEIKPSYDLNRQCLADSIPLSTPYTVFIEPTRFCNFRCFYCIHSTKGTANDAFKKMNYEIKHMDFDDYKRIIHQLLQFPQCPKRIVYSGLGEPLMNPELPKMIKYASEKNAAPRLDVLTNASLLTHEMADQLIDAGTTRLQVSLQGLDCDKYEEVSGISLDYEKLCENLSYLYANRGGCRIFIKTIDDLLDGERDAEKFYTLFGNKCDQIYIEHLITLQHQMGDHGGKADDTRNLNNEAVVHRDVCPVIFYILQIDVDGNVFPCPVSGLPKHFALGNTNETTLVEIWNGSRRKNFIRGHLLRNRDKITVCANCAACAVVLDEKEYLDDEADRLRAFFE